MTRLLMFFFFGVIAGSTGMKLQEQRVERAESRMAAARAIPVSAMKAGSVIATGKDRRTSIAPAPKTVPSIRTPRKPMTQTVDPKRVPVPEGMQPLMSSTYDGRTLAEIHEKLEHEPEDVAWSYQKEQQLSDFFVPAHGSTRFDVRSIECRTTMCEVQAFALGPTQRNTVMEDLQAEPWWDFARSFTEFGEHNGSTTVVLYLLRKT